MGDYIKRLRQYVEANPILFDGEWDHPAMATVKATTWAMRKPRKSAVN